MNDEFKEILNIFDTKVKLSNPINQEKQEKIEKLILETANLEEKKKENNE